MEDNNTFYDLLCEGVEVGELVDAIENRKVNIFDKFGRDNQVPSAEDKAELLAKLELHQKMIWEKNLPYDMRSYECNMYWGYWPFYYDSGGDLAHILVRVWLVGEPKKKEKLSNKESDSKAGKELNSLRFGPQTELKKEIVRLLPEIINRAKRPYMHNIIAQDIRNMEKFGEKPFEKLSIKQVGDVVKEQCYRLNRKDLIKGISQPK